MMAETVQVVFIISAAVVAGIGVFMFFLLGIIEDICNYKLAKLQHENKEASDENRTDR